MLWKGREGSENIEDERNSSGGGTGRGLAIGGGVGGIIIYVLYLLLGGNPSQAPQLGAPSVGNNSQPMEGEDTLKKFVSVVLKDTEDVWASLLSGYKKPKLVVFRNEVQSACGNANAAVGPFYCSGDSKVYIDLSFFKELRDRFGAPGNFAIAYVVAHEIGHHIQNITGISNKIHRQQQQLSEAEANKLSVQMELQADFLAGVWAFHAQQMKNVIEPGDMEAALKAANAIGDDKLQKETQGFVVPDAFTHGTSAQRMYWFKKGFESGNIKLGDTFSDPSLQ